MAKARLDQALVSRGLVSTRSQAESYIKLGKVKVDGKVIKKAGLLVGSGAEIKLTDDEQYVSRAALKLASVAEALQLDFNDKTVLDIGSSTGGFTDFALKHGAARVIAVEAGKEQLHPSLKGNPKIELHEKTDIRELSSLSLPPDIVLIDVSFISLRNVLPHIVTLVSNQADIVAMAKPQFEAATNNLKHNGVIKNDRMRREILKDFERWASQKFVVVDKADSEVKGAKGNQERFYLLKPAS